MDFMIDLETMGNGPDAAIVQIGVVAFGVYTREIIDEMLINVSLEDELANGFTVTASTVEWWIANAYAATWPCDALHTMSALLKLSGFLSEAGDSGAVWSHSTFDAPILFHHYNKMGLRIPVHYTRWLDLRTISVISKGLFSVPKSERPCDAHDALVDCRYQIEWLWKCFDQLSLLYTYKKRTGRTTGWHITGSDVP